MDNYDTVPKAMNATLQHLNESNDYLTSSHALPFLIRRPLTLSPESYTWETSSPPKPPDSVAHYIDTDTQLPDTPDAVQTTAPHDPYGSHACISYKSSETLPFVSHPGHSTAQVYQSAACPRSPCRSRNARAATRIWGSRVQR